MLKKMLKTLQLMVCLSLPGVIQTLCAAELSVEQFGRSVRNERGIVAVIGLPDGNPSLVTKLAQQRELTVYFQSADAQETQAVQEAAQKAGLLGTRIFADSGPLTSIHLSHNVADGIIVASDVVSQTSEAEVLRVMNPNAVGDFGGRQLTKPVPDGMDDWSHPYHGPDNNPQSHDQFVKGDFQTQFIGTPKFSPMPEQSVVAGGRIYKAMGHIAHKANQNEMLNTLLCINAYNGTIQWRRALKEGFLIHRNTMIAAPDALYMGDHESCKVIDGITGDVVREIKIPADISDGPVWKWMALDGDVLFALTGNLEIKVETLRSDRPYPNAVRGSL